MKKNKNKKQEEQEQEKPRFTRCAVMTRSLHRNLTSTLDFEWPEFTKETERVAHNTVCYESLSIVDAFKAGNKSLKISKSTVEPTVPVGLKVGDIIKSHVVFGSFGNVTFSDISTKETIVCRNNIKRFKNVENNRVWDVEVVEVSKKQVVVDLLKPLFNSWVKGILEDPDSQCDLKDPKTILVKDLVLARGGFTGKVSVPVIEQLLGEPYYVDAFIPGSQIVLNIETDFQQWVGKTVRAFVTNYVTKPGSVNQMSLICSAKMYLAYLGDMMKIQMYQHYCDDNAEWKNITQTSFGGKITGIINSSKKCGVFVEIPGLNITGMVNMTPEEVVKYKAGREVFVNIKGFEEMVYFNQTTGQRTHLVPYDISDGVVRNCILKPIFKFA